MSTSSPQIQILFVGDMHLGVLPSHVPAHLAESRQLTAHQLGPAAAWLRVVDTAIENKVHAVALAGDLVEGNNALFEAFGLLESGLRRLSQAHIPVIAVAGNHDTEVLPRLAQRIDKLHLLGQGGTWSRQVVTGDEGLEVSLVGWSFPRPHVETSPLDDGVLPADPQRPTFGLLHADLDQSSSPYAPVTSAGLLAAGYQGWFLGHIHSPGETRNDKRPFYLGSVSGLHPGETGLHGPVLVKLDSRHHMSVERLPLAPLRWEELEVPLTAPDFQVDNLLPFLLDRITSCARALGDSLDNTLALGFRLRLTGSLDDPSTLRRALNQITEKAESLVTDLGGTVLFIDRIVNRTAQSLNLAELARDDSPAGLLARRILVLEDWPQEIPGVADNLALKEDLLARARTRIAEVDGQGAFLGLEDPLSREQTATLLAEAGRRSLEEILRRKETGHAAR